MFRFLDRPCVEAPLSLGFGFPEWTLTQWSLDDRRRRAIMNSMRIPVSMHSSRFRGLALGLMLVSMLLHFWSLVHVSSERIGICSDHGHAVHLEDEHSGCSPVSDGFHGCHGTENDRHDAENDRHWADDGHAETRTTEVVAQSEGLHSEGHHHCAFYSLAQRFSSPTLTDAGIEFGAECPMIVVVPRSIWTESIPILSLAPSHSPPILS